MWTCRRLRHLPGLHRHARPPARARPGAQGDRRHRHAVRGRGRVHRGRLHAQHQAGERQRRRHAAHPAEGDGGRIGARLSDRRGVARAEGRGARRHRGAARGRLRGRHRRRAADCHRDPGASRAGVHQHVRHAGHRALRGSVAQGRGRRARRPGRLVPGAEGHPRRCRGDHRGPGHPAGRDDRRPPPHRAHERVDDARSGAAGQEPRRAR